MALFRYLKSQTYCVFYNNIDIILGSIVIIIIAIVKIQNACVYNTFIHIF